MISFQVNDMTCGHCVSSITKAVKALDSGATVQVDLSTHLVKIEATEADAVELSEAIKEAGYTPVAIAAVTRIAAAKDASPARKGCCCG
ncbi:MAG: heavy-metal-associated domain-containing protein [Burkholderiaceae bacterium]|nr:heavy-metal-associated domain-containing protein [Burkholderiaceae bacterium]